MMERRETVIRAIEFKHPDRVPMVFFNRDFEQGDALLYYFGLQTEDGQSE